MDLRHMLASALLVAVGCSQDAPPSHLWADGARLDGTAFDIPLPPDGFVIGPDAAAPDVACALGTTSDCASCGDICPPGQDSADTARLCLAGKCTIECKEESYDVNGSASDGCEVKDDTPIHDSKATARDLGTSSDCGKPRIVTGVLPSDARKHQKAPTDRPEGRPDWLKLFIDDDPGCIIQADVKVSLKSMPTTSSFRVSTVYTCKGGLELPMDVKTAPGGSEVFLAPSTLCTTIGDDSGTLHVEIAKESGKHSAASYTVEIEP